MIRLYAFCHYPDCYRREIVELEGDPHASLRLSEPIPPNWGVVSGDYSLSPDGKAVLLCPYHLARVKARRIIWRSS